MFVLYVTQMLHNTMATDLKQFGTPNFHDTAKFLQQLNRPFFDCLIERSVKESKRK